MRNIPMEKLARSYYEQARFLLPVVPNQGIVSRSPIVSSSASTSSSPQRNRRSSNSIVQTNRYDWTHLAKLTIYKLSYILHSPSCDTCFIVVNYLEVQEVRMLQGITRQVLETPMPPQVISEAEEEVVELDQEEVEV